MGIPLPILWGLLSFITNYIPYIGFWLGLIPPALLGLLEGGPGMMLAVIALYAVVNFIVQTLIQPKFVGDTADISVTLTVLSGVLGLGARPAGRVPRHPADPARQGGRS